jgi:hypothetical protein
VAFLFWPISELLSASLVSWKDRDRNDVDISPVNVRSRREPSLRDRSASVIDRTRPRPAAKDRFLGDVFSFPVILIVKIIKVFKKIYYMDNSVLPETKTLVFSIFSRVKIWKSYVPNVPYVRARPKKNFPPVCCRLFLQKNGGSSGFRRGFRRRFGEVSGKTLLSI